MGQRVFISGATGYVGRSTIPLLIEAGWRVSALARPGSERKLPAGCDIVPGNALDHKTFLPSVKGCSSFVHLVGTPHPAPWKGEQFRAIDLGSLRESLRAARAADVNHFVYISVAHPAPVMRAYIEVRMQCERMIRESGIAATFLRPWYVLGPGHRWPVALKPFYTMLENIEATREGARRLGLVTLEQMSRTIVWAVENPAGAGVQVIEVPEIRRCGSMAPQVHRNAACPQ